MSTIKEYDKYIESNHEFTYVLRMEYEWYDDKYREMITHVKGIFQEYRNKEVLPKNVIYFFTRKIDFIVGLVSKDVFFTTPPADFTIEEYKELVLKRKSELLEIKEMFFMGDFYGLSSHSFFI